MKKSGLSGLFRYERKENWTSPYRFESDAVLGTHAHYFHGVENYKNRPIIIDSTVNANPVSMNYDLEHLKTVTPNRLLLCGEFMRHPYERIKNKLNVVWFETLDELLKNVEFYLRDGDTVLVKSSHDTGLSKVADLLGETNYSATTNE